MTIRSCQRQPPPTFRPIPCEVVLSKQGQEANAKSVMGVLLLCGAKGTKVRVDAVGERAAEAVARIGELIADRFGEDE
jgi:phosphocarrier protein HPr